MKTLIISHNPISTYQANGKTFLSLFSEFKKEEICQFYVYPSLPDVDICKSYFRITDRDVLRGFFKRKVFCQKVYPVKTEESSTEIEDSFNQKTYGGFRNRKPYRELGRDLMWALSPWYSKELKAWIAEQKPTCIFVAPGRGRFLYNIALKISKDNNLPIVSYVCDDYYSMQAPKTPLGRIWKKLLMRKSEELFSKSSSIITISEEMKNEYSELFNRPTYTIMTGSNIEIAEKPKESENPQVFRYFGGIGLNRYKSLADIGNVLDEINKEDGKDYKLEIYGVDENVGNLFDDINCITTFPFVTGDEFKEKFFSSDFLIHVEGFDEEAKDRVKGSVSTKIADSLASGIPLIAYAPSGIASMEHLKRNNCALCVENKNELKESIIKILSDKEDKIAIIDNALQTARKYHNSSLNSKKVKNICLCKNENS